MLLPTHSILPATALLHGIHSDVRDKKERKKRGRRSEETIFETKGKEMIAAIFGTTLPVVKTVQSSSTQLC